MAFVLEQPHSTADMEAKSQGKWILTWFDSGIRIHMHLLQADNI